MAFSSRCTAPQPTARSPPRHHKHLRAQAATSRLEVRLYQRATPPRPDTSEPPSTADSPDKDPPVHSIPDHGPSDQNDYAHDWEYISEHGAVADLPEDEPVEDVGLDSDLEVARPDHADDDDAYDPLADGDNSEGDDDPGQTNTASGDVDLWVLREGRGRIVRQQRLPSMARIRRWADEGISYQQRLARRLVYALHVGIIPCPGRTHREAEKKHRNDFTGHHGLCSTYSTGRSFAFRSPAESTTEIGLHRHNPIPPAWLRKHSASDKDFPTSQRLQQLFSGTLQEGERVCLHTTPYRPNVEYSFKDIDSSIIFFSNLNQCREPITLSIVSQPDKLLTSSLHLTHPVCEDDGRVAEVPLHWIPHIYFAKAGARGHPILAFFPRRYSPRRDNKAPSPHVFTDSDYRVLYEDILRPAFAQLSSRGDSANAADAGSPTLAHIPRTFSEAKLIAKSASEKSGKGDSAHGRALNLTYTPAEDPQVWAHIVAKLDEPASHTRPELDQFRGLFFVYDAKGLKFETQRQRALLAPISRFMQKQDDIIRSPARSNRNNRRFLDIASEITAEEHVPGCQYGTTLLAKACCVRNTMRFIFEELEAYSEGLPTQSVAGDGTEPHRRTEPRNDQALKLPKVKVQEYPTYLLQDSIKMTAKPGSTHDAFKAGLIYAQTYSAFKRCLDAQGVYPFQHPGIINLGYSEADSRSFSNVDKSVNNREAAKTADIRSRIRIQEALGHGPYPRPSHAPIDTSSATWGWRLEFRVTDRLAEEICQQESCWRRLLDLSNMGGRISSSRTHPTARFEPDPVPQPVDVNNLTFPSDAFYVHDSAEFRHFIFNNVHKHLVAMDLIQILSHTGATSLTAAKLHAILSLSVQHFIGALPQSICWVLERPREAGGDLERVSGLDFARTRKLMGFSFFSQAAINWRLFALGPNYTNLRLPGLVNIARSRAAQGVFEVREFLDDLLGLLDLHTAGPACEFLVDKAVHLMLQCYRDIVLAKLLPTFGTLRRRIPDQSTGKSFTYEALLALGESVGDCLRPANGNKTRFTRGLDLFLWTWTDEPSGAKRDFIKAMPFRSMYEQTRSTLARVKNPYMTAERFDCILAYRFFEQHSVLPYPNSQGHITFKEKKAEGRDCRLLFCFQSLVPAECVPLDSALESLVGEVRHLKTPVRLQQPAPIPGNLDRINSKTEAEAWMRHGANLIRYEPEV